jgi:hypothetical protein
MGFVPKVSSHRTPRWRGVDSNFQYAGAVNLVVAPFMPRKATKGVEVVWGSRVRETYSRAEICDPNGYRIELREWFR